MQESQKVKYLFLSVMAAALICAATLAAVLSVPAPQDEGGTPLKPQRVELPVASEPEKIEEIPEDQWPKVPVPDRDPDYRPERPSWLTADLTEIDPIPGKVAYLTFDDGPSSMTPQVLEVLRKKGATATFFTVHNSNPDCRDYYKEVVDSGCELALHAYEHNLPKIYKSPETYLSDYNAMNDFLFQVAGIHTKQVRFPGGSSQTMTNRSVFWQVMEAAQEEGLIWHDWNVSSGDASPTTHTAEWIYNNIFPAALQFDQPVILMHDVPRNTYTLEALPWIIDTLRANGYRLDVISNIGEPVQHRNPDRDEPPRQTGGQAGSSASPQPDPPKESEPSSESSEPSPEIPAPSPSSPDVSEPSQPSPEPSKPSPDQSEPSPEKPSEGGTDDPNPPPQGDGEA